MKTMNAGRKTLLALAISSGIAGMAGSVMATELPLDLESNWTSSEDLTSTSGSVIKQTLGSNAQINNNSTLIGEYRVIEVTETGKLSTVFNSGVMEAKTGEAIYVAEGGTIGYIKNNGTIIGGVREEDGKQVAIDISKEGSAKQQIWFGSLPDKAGTVEGNIYLNNDVNTSSAIYIYGSEDNKSVFNGLEIKGTKLISNGYKSDAGYLLLKAQNQTMLFDLELSDGSKGKFVNQSGSSLEFELSGKLCEDNTQPCDQAVLDVNGDMEFKGDNAIYITGEIDQIAGTHTLIAADSITGFDETMVKNTWLTNVEVIGGDEDSINIELTYKEDLDPNELMAEAGIHGADVTEQAVLGAFAGIIAANAETTEDTITFTGLNSDALLELGNLLNVTGADAAQLSGELTPDRSGATLHAAQRAQNKQLDAINNRLNSLRADQFHAVNAASSGLWMRVYGNDAKKNVDGRIDGYDVTGMGFSLGIDGDLTENLVTGFAFSQNYQDIGTVIYDTNHEVNTYQFSAYGLWNHDTYFATGSVNAGVDYYDSYRTIGEGTSGVTEYRANAEYKAFHYGLRVTAGMDLAFDNLLLQPIIAGEMNNVSIEAYDESGSVASLSYDKQSVSQVKLGAGFNMSTTYEIGSGILAPHFTAMGWYDFNADDHNIAGSIIIDPSVTGEITTATGSTEVQLNLAAGFDYTIDGGLSLGLGLQHDFVDDGHDTQVQARMNYAF